MTDGNLSFRPDELASGAAFHIHITSPTTAATCGTVNISSAVEDGIGDSSVTGVQTCALTISSITITKTADQGTVSAGNPIGYVITVSNAGAGTARNVTVS